jgi:preprotein translocase subunit SecA
VSELSYSQGLPGLILYPERGDRPDGWAHQLESLVTSVPVRYRAKFGDRGALTFVHAVNALEEDIHKLSDVQLREAAEELRMPLRREGLRAELVQHLFAVVRETARRTIGLRHHDVQLRGAFAMLSGAVAEMNTGEGKTLTATLAASAAALAGFPVHVITVNDYLAGRDAELMGVVYKTLGISVGIIVHDMSPDERRQAYACDITYASNKEIAFDYLRDRLALGKKPSNIAIKLQRLQGRYNSGVVMRGLHFAIVDEADSVLVDEGRTPLIISREVSSAEDEIWTQQTLELIADLQEVEHFEIKLDERSIELTEAGQELLADIGEEWGGIWRSTVRREESARQALTALHLFHLDDHYLIQDGKIQIVDEYSGRVMADRSWSEGLHQLVEAKEGVEITGRKMPAARMTYQRFFRRYKRLSGMTGTAREVTAELWSVYRLPVIRIPTHKPSLRVSYPTSYFSTVEDKWEAITERARLLRKERRPVLIGTRSVKASEQLSEMLLAAKLKHVVLSAAQDGDEAEIIARAGEAGAITVATNMAGRGVDIGMDEGVIAKGGLHVILSEMHEAGRIDRQLQGRCGRAGDPGSYEIMLSFEDSLMEIMGERIPRQTVQLGEKFRAKVAPWLFLWAQRKAERAHSYARRVLLKQDRNLGDMLAFSGRQE